MRECVDEIQEVLSETSTSLQRNKKDGVDVKNTVAEVRSEPLSA